MNDDLHPPQRAASIQRRLLLTALIWTSPEIAFATCSRINNVDPQISVAFPSAINIARDFAVGQVVSFRDIQILPVATPYAGCSAGAGSIIFRGTRALSSGSNNIFDSGIPGIGLRISMRHGSGVYGTIPYTNPILGPVAIVWTPPQHAHVELVKTASVTGTGTVTPGQFVQGTLDSGEEILSIAVAPNGIRVNTVSCTTPDFTVNLGTHAHTELRTINSFTSSTNFSIPLNNCPAGIQAVKYKVDAVTAILDANRAIVALNANSTANGVGVQLLDGSGNVHPFGTTRTAAGINAAGGNFAIPLRARYFRTGSGISGGTANTSMTFTISYE